MNQTPTFDSAQSTLDKIRSEFSFLVSDLGFSCVSEEKRQDHRGQAVITYKNQYVQIECAGSQNFFHAEIRKLINGEPSEYNDRGNAIGMEDLAKLESDYSYDHMQYFAGGKTGFDGVTKNVAALFRRNAKYLTTSDWIDIKKLNDLEDSHFLRTFGRIPNREAKSPVDDFEEAAREILSLHGFRKTRDSRNMAPYDSSSVTLHGVWSNAQGSLKLTQADWRDDYTHWILSYNGKVLGDTDFAKTRNHVEAINSLVAALDKVKSN